jgi:hypothetical protein
VAEPRRDDFPNNFVGDLLHTERGWVVVPPTACPAGHDYTDSGWAVSSVWCSCGDRHMEWRCCGQSIYAPQPGQHCRIRDRGPVSMYEDETRGHRGEGPMTQSEPWLSAWGWCSAIFVGALAGVGVVAATLYGLYALAAPRSDGPGAAT